MSKYSLLFLFLSLSCHAFAQRIGIDVAGPAPHNSALLDLNSTTKGLLIPRMTTAQMNAITLPAKGLLLYNTTTNHLWLNRGTSTFVNFQRIPHNVWALDGNTGTMIGTHFLGTTSLQSLKFITNNTHSGLIDPVRRNTFFGFETGNMVQLQSRNVAIGSSALGLLNNGYGMTAIGDSALFFSSTTLDDFSVAVGARAGKLSHEGALNTFVGYAAGYGNTYANDNVAFGANAFRSAPHEYYVVAIGAGALGNAPASLDSILVIGDSAVYEGSNSPRTIAIGHKALRTGGGHFTSIYIGYESARDAQNSEFTIGIGHRTFANADGSVQNIAIGRQAMENCGTAENNVALGTLAMQNLASGDKNIAIGDRAARNIGDASYCVAIGSLALRSTETSDRNIAIGDSTLIDLTVGGGSNTVLGTRAGISMTTGDQNVLIGSEAGYDLTSGEECVAVGHQAIQSTTTSSGITAAGRRAGDAFNMGNNNTFLGTLSTANANNHINSVALGYQSTITANNQVRIGISTTSSIGGFQTWSNLSDGRFKKEVKSDIPGLSFIRLLRPVTYSLDLAGISSTLEQHETRGEEQQIRQTGLIAQEVEEAARVVGYEFSGVDQPKNESDFYGLRYAEFVVPLTQAVKEQQEQIERLKAENAELLSQLEQLEQKRK